MDKHDAKSPAAPGAAPLAEQNDALGFYLDSLLMDLPEEVSEEASADETVAVPKDAREAADAPVASTATAVTTVSPQSTAMPVTAAKHLAEESAADGKLTPSPAVDSHLLRRRAAPAADTLVPRVRKPVPVTPASETKQTTRDDAASPPKPMPQLRPAQAAAMPLEMKRTDFPARPFTESPPPQALLSAPPVMPLLLCDVPAANPEPVVDRLRVPAQKAVKTAVEPPLKASPEIVIKTARQPFITPPAPVVDVKPVVPIQASTVAAEAATAVPVDMADRSPAKTAAKAAENKIPDWAQNRFQCLSFTVAGLTLAAPLEKLHGIVEWQAEITALPGYANWFMGLLQNRGENVRVIDTAQIIMPDGRRPDARPVLERIKYVVLIDGGRWGLAVDSIGQVLTLETDGVRWRGERSKRPWLAGTAVEQMCAVLDMDSLSEQLLLGLKLDD